MRREIENLEMYPLILEDLRRATDVIKDIPEKDSFISGDPEFDIEEAQTKYLRLVQCLEYLQRGIQEGFIVVFQERTEE